MAKTSRSRKAEAWWAELPEPELMQLRLKDLKLSVDGTWLEECMDQLHHEMEQRGLGIRAHAWLADEWFSPHNTPGIAIPFYLAHPRLMRLERKKVLEVEGGAQRDCMRILRHEMGHVVQHLTNVHRRKRWQDLFGNSSLPYPDHYRPNPVSRRYVQHLRRWYAQCHPDEDFAETFAVWLAPRSQWRKRYAEWNGALKKLEYVEELMAELADKRAPTKRRFNVDPISENAITLGKFYEKKLERYAVDTPSIFDRDLQRIFSAEQRHRDAPQAAAFIRRNRSAIRQSVARWAGEYPLTLDAALDDVIDRCRVLKLRAPRAERHLRVDLTALLTTSAVHTLYSSSRRQSFAV